MGYYWTLGVHVFLQNVDMCLWTNTHVRLSRWPLSTNPCTHSVSPLVGTELVLGTQRTFCLSVQGSALWRHEVGVGRHRVLL